MGGIGSGRWHEHQRAQVVEGCLSLSPGMFDRTLFSRVGEVDRLLEGVGTAFSYGAEGIAATHIRLPTLDAGIELHYRVKPLYGAYSDQWQIVPFVPLPRHFGGSQIYWLCPECNQRVLWLYRPFTEALHLCRQCHKLTYQSSRNSHQFDRGYIASTYPELIQWERRKRLEKRNLSF